MLIPRDDGCWEYVRVKNEPARSLSIGRRDALDIARRTAAIADRLGRPCHVMWFIGCADQGSVFSVPWYWIEAHDADKNPDRLDYQGFRISDRDDLERFKQSNGQRAKQAIELMPTDLNLMRDMKFIKEVGATAINSRVPLMWPVPRPFGRDANSHGPGSAPRPRARRTAARSRSPGPPRRSIPKSPW
jgi:hypothetical protein